MAGPPAGTTQAEMACSAQAGPYACNGRHSEVRQTGAGGLPSFQTSMERHPNGEQSGPQHNVVGEEDLEPEEAHHVAACIVGDEVQADVHDLLFRVVPSGD